MWIELNGAVNVRDVGGLPTRDGTKTRHKRLLRSDNLQGLTAGDVSRLTGELNLSDVIDLRTRVEVDLEGPGPLTRVAAVTIHHHSLLVEAGDHTDVAAIDGEVFLPWRQRTDDDRKRIDSQAAGFYLEYFYDRPDSVVSAMRVIAHSEGAALVHCAAGKDRTGVITAMALDAVGVDREAIIDDYTRTGEKMDQVLARLKASPTYAADLDGRPASSHMPRPETMRAVLSYFDDEFGGSLAWLAAHGWADLDTESLQARLVS